MLTLTIKEEVFGSGSTSNLNVDFHSKKITLAELIQIKVAAKVKMINAEIEERGMGHRFFSENELILNRTIIQKQQAQLKKQKFDLKIDPEKAGYEALAGFKSNAFFVLFNGEQKTELEEELILTENTNLHFVRLMPLIGG